MTELTPKVDGIAEAKISSKSVGPWSEAWNGFKKVKSPSLEPALSSFSYWLPFLDRL